MENNIDKHEGSSDVANHSSSLNNTQFNEQKIGVSVGISQNSEFLKHKRKRRCADGKTSLGQSSGKNKQEDPSLSSLQNTLKKRRKNQNVSKLKSNGVVIAAENTCHLSDNNLNSGLNDTNDFRCIQNTSGNTIDSFVKINIDKAVDSTGNDHHRPCLGSNIVIPKRPRGASRRKKLVNSATPNGTVEGVSCSIHNSNTNACCSMLSGDSVTTPSTVMTKMTLNEVNEHRENGSEQGRIEVPVEKVQSNNKYENESFNVTQTKIARKRKKKYSPSGKHADVIKKDTPPKKTNESVDNSHEENLEEYAARMLSSRFAPSCTGFSGSASPQKQANGFTVPPSSFSADSNALGPKQSPGFDASRVLRPRSRNGKNGVRKRRHFYEVRASDMDPFWVVERKIKVFWPLDEIWYFGIVKDYNPVTGLHHVNYVDREEEWIDLNNERFKLLMFPSEFTCKADFRKCDNNAVQEEKVTANAVEDDCSSNLMESEPIISWLTRSLDRMKPPPKVKKKSSSSKRSTRHCADTQDHTVPHSGIGSNKTTDFITSRLVNDIAHMPVFKNEEGTVDRRYSLFYSRRRFHKRRKITDNVFEEILADSHLILKYRFLRVLEFDLTSNTLKLNQGTPVVMLSLQKNHNLAFSSQGIWLSNIFWWLHFGKLITLCPEIHIEIYFLDNITGLKIVSFEGCLSRAVVILRLILKTFQHCNGCWKSTQDQHPFASIGFKFSHLQDSGRHLLFVAHYYMELESLKLRYLHKTLQKYCVPRQEIPVSECTYANTKRLLDKGYMSPLPEDEEGTFLLGRHLKFLMKKKISSYSFQNQNDRQEFNARLTGDGYLPVDNSSRLEDISLVDKSDERSNSCLDTANDQKQLNQVEGHLFELEAKAIATNNTTLQFSSKRHHDRRDPVLSSSGSQSRAWPENFGFVNGYRKPRTRVSYSSPFGGYHSGKESQNRRQKAHPYKKIRSDTSKKLTPVSKKCQKNLTSLICEANVLVTEGDKGWREHAAQVLLDYDDQEWKILIKLSGAPKYSHKPHQILQPGATNRYTHAMLWKGGKNWTLEFTDRGQWALFKEMHEECYNQNIRVASVKNIPIPGVHLIEENYDCTSAVPFTRGFPNYIMQVGTEVDVAMDRSHVVYDMDSDDEEWVSKQGNTIDDDANKTANISCEMFENAVDMLEKIAYAEQCDEFSDAEIMCFMEEIGPPEAIKRIHEYWFSKRQKKGMALIQQFQPPLWEQYQKQLKEWELAVSANANSSNDHGNGRIIEKPPMFAFCLKPRGLEAPIKGSKQRSHKKFTGSGKHSMVLRDQDHLQGSGRPSISIPDHESSDSSHWLQSPTGFSPRYTVNTAMANGRLERNQYLEFQRGNYKKARLFSSNRDFHVTSNSYNKKVKRHHADVEEYRLRDASSAAQHASNMAKLKREKAQWLMHKADLALNRFAVALMNAEAMKASEEDVIEEE